MQAPQENPYNGGLIDFHESALRADLGAALYAHQLAGSHLSPYPMAAHPSQYPAAAHTPQYPIQGHTHAHTHAHAAYAPAVPQYQVPFPPPQSAPAPIQSMMMSQAPGQCIAGPPAFLHLHGKVYAPIEESAAPVPEPVALKEPALIQSGRALDRMVEQRVEQRVNEYFAKSKGKALGGNMRSRKQAPKAEDSLKELNGAMRARLSAY